MQKPSMLEKQVVIIIPTHNRQYGFSRLFAYYSDWKCRLILVDSSQDRFSGNLPNNFTYLHFPGQSFYAKILKSLEEVQEPFVALCADDDVFFMYGFYSCVNELAGGNCGICKGDIGKFNPAEFKEWFFLKPWASKTRHYPKGSGQPRLLAEYSQILWSVYERGLLAEIFALLVAVKPKNDNYIELLIAAVGQYRAGVTVIAELFLIREISPTLSWGCTAIPISVELGKKPKEERLRIIEKVASLVPGCPVGEDIDLYIHNRPGGLYSRFKFRLYQLLARNKRIGWHMKRELQGYDKLRWGK